MIASFIDGPLWYFSATVFVIGVIWRLFAILRLRGRKKVLSKPRNTTGGGALATILRRFVPYREFATVSRSRVIAGYAFHLGLFALLFFAAPHMEFIRDRITGFGWTPLARLVGLLVLLVGIISSATLARGFVAYLQVFVTLPEWLVLTLLAAALGGLAAWGVSESLRLAALFTLIEIGGLLLVLWWRRRPPDDSHSQA